MITYERERRKKGYTCFAWLPTSLTDGRYIWLQTYWVIAVPMGGDIRSPTLEEALEYIKLYK
jgi:hypothetical protein